MVDAGVSLSGWVRHDGVMSGLQGEATGLVRVRDPEQWAWFADGVAAGWCPWASAGAVLPAHFETVVRVFPPAQDGSTWEQVAAESGRVAHPLMQWTHIEQRCGMASRSGEGPLVFGDRVPEAGNPPADLLEAVLEHCPAEGAVFHGVWVGYNQWDDPSNEALLVIPGREYRIFKGPKAAFRDWPDWQADRRGRSANLVWPADHSWVVAAEIDWPCLLVAGPAELTDSIHANPGLEAHRVPMNTPLDWSSDTINPPFWQYP